MDASANPEGKALPKCKGKGVDQDVERKTKEDHRREGSCSSSWKSSWVAKEPRRRVEEDNLSPKLEDVVATTGWSTTLD